MKLSTIHTRLHSFTRFGAQMINVFSRFQVSRLVFSIVAGMFVLVGLGKQVYADDYVVALNHAPPYRIIESTSDGTKFSGFYIEIIKELARRLDFSLTFKEVPFRRAIAMMENGSADIMVGPNRTAEREKFMMYLDEELSRERKAFFIQTAAPDIVQYEGLADKKIGVLRGSVYFDRFDADNTLNKFDISDYSSVLNMVDKGRLDTAIAPEMLGDFTSRILKFNLKKASYKIEGRPSFIAVSKKSALREMKKKLNAALREIKADGTMAQFTKNYR
ncbi:MAG: hypothetical protein COB59_03425 [Rhodospirillaceae bacterium]|nr:MAG: hypothetical protein COB59_03425 [Rhodospirillaceae bacterium]